MCPLHTHTHILYVCYMRFPAIFDFTNLFGQKMVIYFHSFISMLSLFYDITRVQRHAVVDMVRFLRNLFKRSLGGRSGKGTNFRTALTGREMVRERLYSLSHICSIPLNNFKQVKQTRQIPFILHRHTSH